MNADHIEATDDKLNTLRTQTKMIALTRVKEALEGDVWSDVAKLAKDAYVMLIKEDATDGAKAALAFQMIASVAGDEERRRYVEAKMEGIRPILGAGIE